MSRKLQMETLSRLTEEELQALGSQTRADYAAAVAEATAVGAELDAISKAKAAERAGKAMVDTMARWRQDQRDERAFALLIVGALLTLIGCALMVAAAIRHW